MRPSWSRGLDQAAKVGPEDKNIQPKVVPRVRAYSQKWSGGLHHTDKSGPEGQTMPPKVSPRVCPAKAGPEGRVSGLGQSSKLRSQSLVYVVVSERTWERR